MVHKIIAFVYYVFITTNFTNIFTDDFITLNKFGITTIFWKHAMGGFRTQVISKYRVYKFINMHSSLDNDPSS